MTSRRWYSVLPAAVLAVAIGACSAPTSSAPATTSSRPPGPGDPLVPTVSDVAYANASDIQHLDLYLPASSGRAAPLVIWMHGGGWRAGDKSLLSTVPDLAKTPPPRVDCHTITEVQLPDVEGLNAKGYAVAAINYHIDHDPVAAVQDAKAAVRFLRANASRYHLDPNRFAAWGDSAGGYSAIMLAVTADQHTVFDNAALGNANVSSAVQAVVDWYGASDLTDIPGNNGPAEDPFTYIAAGKHIPPFIMAQGDQDCVVVLQHSQRLHDALVAAGVSATLNVLHGAGHEDPAFMRTQWAPTMAFLNRTLHQ